jgi:hypothetical protein
MCNLIFKQQVYKWASLPDKLMLLYKEGEEHNILPDDGILLI